jgi:Putative Ig domain
MKLIYPRCCVLAVQGQTVLACLRIQEDNSPAHDEVRTFAILPAELATLSDWLAAHGVTHVAIAGTSYAWKPVHGILQQAFTVLLINPSRVRDVQDIRRIASLMAYGLEPGRALHPTPLQEPSRRRRRKLIAVGAAMLATLLVLYGVWIHPGRMSAEHLPSPPPVQTVRWQQPYVSYQYPAGQQFTLALPPLERSPEGLPVEVALEVSGDRPSWLTFDRERLSMRGRAPRTAEEKTYQFIVRAQAEHGSESRLQVSLTIKGQPELAPASLSTEIHSPPASQASQPLPAEHSPEQAGLLMKSKKEPPDPPVAPEASAPPPSQASQPLPSEHSPEQARLLMMLKRELPDSPVSTEGPVVPTAQASKPLPPERPPEKARLLTILKGDRPASSVPSEEPPPEPPVAKPLPSARPAEKDCVLRILKGEPCVSGQ